MMGGWYGFGAGLGWLGMVVMPLVWLTVLALIVWAVTRFIPAGPADERESALDILKRRYARGEISQVEFDQARKALA